MDQTLLTTSFFKGNRKKLSLLLKQKSIAIVHSNDEMHRTGDQNYPFRQNSNLFYLTGINQEKTTLILAPDYPDENLREVLFIRKSDKTLETWEGKKLSTDEAREISGIKNVKWIENLDAVLRELLYFAEIIYFDNPEALKYKSDNPYRSERYLKTIKKNYPLHNYERMFPLLAGLRMIKEPEEIANMKKACSITRDGFLRILKTTKPGMMEYGIEAELTHEFIRLNADGHAYPPIIASGKNACVLHYVTNKEQCKDGDLLLLDIGSELNNYASDLSRTIPVNGRFTKRQRELYDATLRVFKFAKSLMKPGTTINKIHDQVCKKWEEEHILLGLYSYDDVKNSKENLWFKYYMHGTSHFLGLDVHDVGKKTDELKPGMVITCEPGIYIPEENTGIRLENDILITEEGNIDLMESIPIEADEIEQLMKK